MPLFYMNAASNRLRTVIKFSLIVKDVTFFLLEFSKENNSICSKGNFKVALICFFLEVF